MDSIELRLLKLERANRVWRHMASILVLGTFAVVLMGPASALPPVIRARSFEVVAPDGQRMAFLGPSAANKAVGLVLYDHHGQIRTALDVGTDGPAELRFLGADGTRMAELGFTKKWVGALFGDQAGRRRIFVGTTGDGPAMLLMHAPDNKAGAGLWIDADGGYMLLDDKDGKKRFSVPPSTRPTSQPHPVEQ